MESQTGRSRSTQQWVRLADRILALGNESETVEFKENNTDPQMIGQRVSALSNGAALQGESSAYLVWGVQDDDRDFVGTSFDPWKTKGKGNEDLLPWLSRSIQPALALEAGVVERDGSRLVILEIPAAHDLPTTFCGEAWIRRQSYCKKLSAEPDLAKRLWSVLNDKSFESGKAAQDLDEGEVLALLDYPAYFSLLQRPLPENRAEILEALRGSGVADLSVTDGWSVSNAGALLLAHDLSQFSRLSRKTVRVIAYGGTDRLTTLQEYEERRGYAASFQTLVSEVLRTVPKRESIVGGLRESGSAYPEIAVRELLANALVHQDLVVRGSGPMVEIFSDRIEITNPGKPLTDYRRFLDSSPLSRNEKVARLMRLFRVCEERGSGWDKVVDSTERAMLPAPRVRVDEYSTRVTLLGARPLSTMEPEDRINAIYLHACLRYVNEQPMTNASVRARFGIEQRNSSQVSRFIKEAIEEGLIVVYDPDAGTRARRYVPAWADPRRTDQPTFA